MPSDFAHAFQRFPRAAKPTPWRAMQQWAHIRRMIDMNHQSQTANNLFFLLNVAKKNRRQQPVQQHPIQPLQKTPVPAQKTTHPFFILFCICITTFRFHVKFPTPPLTFVQQVGVPIVAEVTGTIAAKCPSARVQQPRVIHNHSSSFS